MNSKVPLQGAELEEYLAKERAVKEKAAAAKAAEERRQRILEADEADTEDDESDSDSDDDENEVERTLENEMDIDQDSKPRETKRKDGKRSGTTGKAAWSSALEDDGVAKQMLSYDIYLKGNVSKATSFFKSADGQSQRFRMFPYIEKKRRIDEYGELLDVEMWLRKGKALEIEGESEEMKEMKKVQAEEELKVGI
jgi:cleavage and polyadenylation specificity factor subunit 2